MGMPLSKCLATKKFFIENTLYLDVSHVKNGENSNSLWFKPKVNWLGLKMRTQNFVFLFSFYEYLWIEIIFTKIPILNLYPFIYATKKVLTASIIFVAFLKEYRISRILHSIYLYILFQWHSQVLNGWYIFMNVTQRFTRIGIFNVYFIHHAWPRSAARARIIYFVNIFVSFNVLSL